MIAPQSAVPRAPRLARAFRAEPGPVTLAWPGTGSWGG